jgi:LPLT family lysophospholipid transporter-like MFS transporter
VIKNENKDLSMTSNNNSGNGLFSRSMLAVLVSQFLTALGDNALLFAAIALLKSQAAPGWQTPLLQEFFVIAFILLAPFVGPFADTWPKGRVMLVANSFKFLGVSAMYLGLHPLLAYNLVGVGAAAYSPAKYGILSQLVGQDKLVKANSLIEGSTIVAILLGAVIGGVLADWSISGALISIAVVYLLAIVANFLIPRLPPEHPLNRIAPLALAKDFIFALRALLNNPDARFSLIGTSIFWGAGSTLRFLLVAWVPVALHIMQNSTPANLSGVVAIGIALGAAAAARFVDLKTVNRALPAGMLIGALIIVFAHLNSLYTSIAVLVLIGACGGFYVVPLNALLQERGHETVGAGHAIAVQNFFENLFMLIMVGLYVLMDRSGINVIATGTGFGVLVFVSIGVLAWSRTHRKSR